MALTGATSAGEAATAGCLSILLTTRIPRDNPVVTESAHGLPAQLLG